MSKETEREIERALFFGFLDPSLLSLSLPPSFSASFILSLVTIVCPLCHQPMLLRYSWAERYSANMIMWHSNVPHYIIGVLF